MKLLYIIGVPGSGKTTAIRRITKHLKGEVRYAPYISWTHYNDEVCQIGYDRDTFGGTDALGMASQKRVIEWLENCEYEYVLAEGDRLANAKFFDWCKSQGIDLTVMCIDVSDKLAEKRRSKRNSGIGKQQNEQWLKTRRTKVENLKAKYVKPKHLIDGNQKPDAIANAILKHPVAKRVFKSS